MKNWMQECYFKARYNPSSIQLEELRRIVWEAWLAVPESYNDTVRLNRKEMHSIDSVTMKMLRYLSDSDRPAPGTLAASRNPSAGRELPELAEFSSSDVSPTHQRQPDPDTNRDSEAREALCPRLSPNHAGSRGTTLRRDQIPNGMGAGARSCSTDTPR
jgi:hypothetical protein